MCDLTVPTGSPITFSDETVTTAQGGVLVYTWDFGDGNGSSAQNPTHTYTTAGTYTVTFIAASACGPDTLVAADVITVNAPPAPVERPEMRANSLQPAMKSNAMRPLNTRGGARNTTASVTGRMTRAVMTRVRSMAASARPLTGLFARHAKTPLAVMEGRDRLIEQGRAEIRPQRG